MVATPSVRLASQHVVVQLDQAEAGVTIQIHRRRADLQLGTAFVVDPQSIAAGQRAIQCRVGPFFGTGRRDSDFAIDVAEASDTAGRVDHGARRDWRSTIRWRTRVRPQVRP